MIEMFELTITNPDVSTAYIDYGRNFMVSGAILHDEEVPEDAILKVSLYDQDGNLLRYARQEQKDSRKVYLDHPGMTFYPQGMDDDRKKLLEFGFPELQVKDLRDPWASLKDATIKAFYDDKGYKAMIVSATDVSHGAILEDGIGYCDENGDPYDVLPEGDYRILVELYHHGRLLAEASRDIAIAIKKNAIICRFNPVSHKKAMVQFARKNGIDITTDTLPGYLEPYLGVWYYHMGLLQMYRANDITFYQQAFVHFFVYLITPDSTSYQTELAYLRQHRDIEDRNGFRFYHYDTGEAYMEKANIVGRIIPFEKEEYLYTCRVDIVEKTCQENVLYLDEREILESQTDLNEVIIFAHDTIAVMNVLRPQAIDPKYLKLNEDNTYEIGNEVTTLHYEFQTEEKTYGYDRKLMMERIDKRSIGKSVFESYNVFHLPEEMSGSLVTVTITAYDRFGNRCKGESRFLMKVI